MGSDISSEAQKRSKFQGGQMYIELESGDFVVEAGETIKGKVSINQLETYKATNLVLLFEGNEKSCYDKGLSRNSTCDIVKFATVLKTFEGNQITPGQYQVPFEIRVPDWIPASMIHVTKMVESALMIRYQLHVKLETPEPVSKENQIWTQQRILVQRKDDLKLPALVEPLVVDHQANLKAFMGSASESKATVTMPKMIFTAGDKIPVQFSVDNSQSSTKVKYYNIKIKRKTTCGGGWFNRSCTIVETKKDANCPAQGQENVVVELQIPEKEVNFTTHTNYVSKDDMPIKYAFSCSTVGKNMTLRYIIYVEVKHDVMGEKETNRLVLKREIIIQTPSFAKQELVQEEEDDTCKKPTEWEPVVDGIVMVEPSEQAHTANMNDYYNDVIAPSVEANIKNLHKDVEMAEDDEQEEQ